MARPARGAEQLERARSGDTLVVSQIKAELEAALGRTMALSTVYNALHRNGWRKLAPDKRHPQSDEQAQAQWKKLPERLAEIDANWIAPGPIKVIFQDEARFECINDVRRRWAPKPIRPMCQAMLTHQYTYTYAAVDVCTGELDTLILPHINTPCMQVFCDEVGQRHPGQRIVMILDGAGSHASSKLSPPPNVRLLPLPPYAPELNPIEHIWDELREKSFHNRVFDSLDALEDHLELSLRALEQDHHRIRSIVAWPWIINALMA